jgi:hypothetical protein
VRVSVSVEVVEGLFCLEVLELDGNIGVDILDGSHELVHEVLLGLDRHTLLAQTKVKSI